MEFQKSVIIIRRILFIISVFTLSGCSTLKNQTLIAGAAGFVVCSVIGASAAPKSEKDNLHGLLYGGLCSSTAMAVSEYMKKDSRTSENIRSEDLINVDNNLNNPDKEDIKARIMSSDTYKKLPIKIRKKFRRGQWNLFMTDEWFLDGDVFTNEMMKIEFYDVDSNEGLK